MRVESNALNQVDVLMRILYEQMREDKTGMEQRSHMSDNE